MKSRIACLFSLCLALCPSVALADESCTPKDSKVGESPARFCPYPVAQTPNVPPRIIPTPILLTEPRLTGVPAELISGMNKYYTSPKAFTDVSKQAFKYGLALEKRVSSGITTYLLFKEADLIAYSRSLQAVSTYVVFDYPCANDPSFRSSFKDICR